VPASAVFIETGLEHLQLNFESFPWRFAGHQQLNFGRVVQVTGVVYPRCAKPLDPTSTVWFKKHNPINALSF
jgi:hypothetical protein